LFVSAALAAVFVIFKGAKATVADCLKPKYLCILKIRSKKLSFTA
jgi:hypothetical protein